MVVVLLKPNAAELTANAAKKAITTTKATSLRSKTLDFAFNKPFPLSCGKGFFWDGFAFASILHNLNPLRKLIHIFEPQDEKKGAEVTFSTPKGRKTFHLPRPKKNKPTPPLAIESFAYDPQEYAILMEGVERLSRSYT